MHQMPGTDGCTSARARRHTTCITHCADVLCALQRPVVSIGRVRGRKVSVMAEYSAGWQKSWQNALHFVTLTGKAGKRLLASSRMYCQGCRAWKKGVEGDDTWQNTVEIFPPLTLSFGLLQELLPDQWGPLARGCRGSGGRGCQKRRAA